MWWSLQCSYRDARHSVIILKSLGSMRVRALPHITEQSCHKQMKSLPGGCTICAFITHARTARPCFNGRTWCRNLSLLQYTQCTKATKQCEEMAIAWLCRSVQPFGNCGRRWCHGGLCVFLPVIMQLMRHDVLYNCLYIAPFTPNYLIADKSVLRKA